MRKQLKEIKQYMSKASKTSKDIEELRKKVKLLEDRLDDGHSLDLARDFTLPEIKNICIKVCTLTSHHITKQKNLSPTSSNCNYN